MVPPPAPPVEDGGDTGGAGGAGTDPPPLPTKGATGVAVEPLPELLEGMVGVWPPSEPVGVVDEPPVEPVGEVSDALGPVLGVVTVGPASAGNCDGLVGSCAAMRVVLDTFEAADKGSGVRGRTELTTWEEPNATAAVTSIFATTLVAPRPLTPATVSPPETTATEPPATAAVPAAPAVTPASPPVATAPAPPATVAPPPTTAPVPAVAIPAVTLALAAAAPPPATAAPPPLTPAPATAAPPPVTPAPVAAAPPAPAPAAPAATAHPVQHRAEHRGLQAERKRHRNDQGERGPLTARLALEVGAARAAVDVSPDHAARQDRVVRHRDPLADVRARMSPGEPATGKTLAGLVDECLHLGRSDADDVRDLLMGVVAQLEQDKRGSLVIRQPVDLVNHLAQVLTALHLVRQIAEVRLRIGFPRLALAA